MERIGKIVLFSARAAVSAVFIYAAVAKIARPDEFYFAVLNYRILPMGLSQFVAYFLPPLELLCGIMFLSKKFTISSGAIMLVLLAAFVLAISSAYFRGLDIDCGCFGSAAKSGGYFAPVLRDAALMLAICAVCFFSELRGVRADACIKQCEQIKHGEAG
ncbi:MAG: hypothetical protein J6R08_07000 [Opitutales bacterium]|nr:hypothetical protein [Opitutales bacterium]